MVNWSNYVVGFMMREKGINKEKKMKAINLRVDYLKNPLGLQNRKPKITWNIVGGKQDAFEVRAKRTLGEDFSSGVIESSKMNYSFDVEFLSKERVDVEVIPYCGNVAQEAGVATFEIGLLPEDWTAKWINPELETVPEIHEYDPTEKEDLYKLAAMMKPHEIDKGPNFGNRPASYLKKTFTVKEIGNARMYATAHGIYNVYINGVYVEGFNLAPGTSQYNVLMQYQTYDVSKYLKIGENEIVAVIGNGWWRGQVQNQAETNCYGNDVALLLQIENDGKELVSTDKTWVASQSGALRDTDNMEGEVYDARREVITDWHEVKEENFRYDNLIAADEVPVREKEHFKAKLFIDKNGDKVLDFGQNIAGYVSFKLNAHEGQRIQLFHGEELENGVFTTEHLMGWQKELKQRVDYICKEGLNEYKTTCAVFGFRYVKVITDVEIDGSEFESIAVYSDMDVISEFTCGNELVNQFVKNAVWSVKGNFLDVPTDCPTRERSGFSGDLQSFAYTALYLTDCYSVLRKWLDNQAATQYTDGCVKQIVPEMCGRGVFDGSNGWSDSIDLIPYQMYLRTGDAELLTRYYDNIKKWVEYNLKRAKDVTRPENMDNPNREYLVDSGMHWGEWIEPTNNPNLDAMRLGYTASHGEPEFSTCYLFIALNILTESAKILGKSEDAEKYGALIPKAKEAYRYYSLKNGLPKDLPKSPETGDTFNGMKLTEEQLQMVKKQQMIESMLPKPKDRMCKYVRPLYYRLLSADEVATTAKALNDMVVANDYHLGTGFMTTHLLCRTLTDNGYHDSALKILLQDKSLPSWLVSVKKGATTVWENWNAIDDDGKLYGSMNHYAFGAVCSWLYDSVLGIRFARGELSVKPIASSELGFAKGHYDSPVGRVESAWTIDGENATYTITVPDNVDATIILPSGRTEKVNGGTHVYTERVC